MGDTFVFSIEAAYSGVGSLGNMGTYIGNEGGPYLFLSREPLACAAGKKNKYLVKVQASHFLIDTSAKTYGSLLHMVLVYAFLFCATSHFLPYFVYLIRNILSIF